MLHFYNRHGFRHSSLPTAAPGVLAPAPSSQKNGADGAPARGLRSEDVRLADLRRCGTNVRGLWVCDRAMLRSVEEQRRVHFESTVCLANPCTTSCCPQLCAPSPCSSTHSITPARTVSISGGTLKKRTALSLKLPPVVRAQVGSEALDLILGGDNATSVLQIRPGDVCFAVLEVLSLGAFTRAVVGRGAAGALRAPRASKNDWLVPSLPCTKHMHANRVCNYVFSAHAR